LTLTITREAKRSREIRLHYTLKADNDMVTFPETIVTHVPYCLRL